MTGEDRSFRRECRILDGKGFDTVFRNGKRIGTRDFVLYIALTSFHSSRLGIIASRRFGRAVQRNRAKRVLREVFRHHRRLLQPPVDIVAIARRSGYPPGLENYEQAFLGATKRFYKHLENSRRHP